MSIYYSSMLSLMYFSNSLRLISFFLPMYKVKGHLGFFDNSLILFIPILLYAAASSIVSVAFSQIGTSIKSIPPFLVPVLHFIFNRVVLSAFSLLDSYMFIEKSFLYLCIFPVCSIYELAIISVFEE